MTDSAVKAAKKALRQQMLYCRRSRALEQNSCDSQQIVQTLQAWPYYQQAKVVMAYLAMPDEVSLDVILEHAVGSGKQICVPRLSSVFGMMEAGLFTGFEHLEIGKLGLRSPLSTAECVDPTSLNLILVPGVAFTTSGGRLGMGAGYYDRFLLRAPQAMRVGICFSNQVVTKLCQTEFDVNMQWLLTEQGLIECCH